MCGEKTRALSFAVCLRVKESQMLHDTHLLRSKNEFSPSLFLIVRCGTCCADRKGRIPKGLIRKNFCFHIMQRTDYFLSLPLQRHPTYNSGNG